MRVKTSMRPVTQETQHSLKMDNGSALNLQNLFSLNYTSYPDPYDLTKVEIFQRPAECGFSYDGLVYCPSVYGDEYIQDYKMRFFKWMADNNGNTKCNPTEGNGYKAFKCAAFAQYVRENINYFNHFFYSNMFRSQYFQANAECVKSDLTPLWYEQPRQSSVFENVAESIDAILSKF